LGVLPLTLSPLPRGWSRASCGKPLRFCGHDWGYRPPDGFHLPGMFISARFVIGSGLTSAAGAVPSFPLEFRTHPNKHGYSFLQHSLVCHLYFFSSSITDEKDTSSLGARESCGGIMAHSLMVNLKIYSFSMAWTGSRSCARNPTHALMRGI